MGPATKVSHVWSSHTLGPTRVSIAPFYNVWFGSSDRQALSVFPPTCTQGSWTLTDGPAHFPITCPLRYCSQHRTTGDFASTQSPPSGLWLVPFPGKLPMSEAFGSSALAPYSLSGASFLGPADPFGFMPFRLQPPFFGLVPLDSSGFVPLAPDTLLTNT